MRLFTTNISYLLTVLFICSLCGPLKGNERPTDPEKPNFLWVTFEDASPYGFSCYGNKTFLTPTVDSLSKKGTLFTNAYSTAPHCSPSRSTLITGSFATTYGMDIHREKYETPGNIFYPTVLRANGYYCTNNKKTDYNTLTDDQPLWDESGANAGYNSDKRGKNQPFFAVFNATASHMSRVRTVTTEGRGRYRGMGISPDKLILPKYVPDLPEVRSDYAVHLESYIEIDEWLKTILEDLRQRHLDENTIIFFFSDHGGCLPRGKGYPYESGLKVPLIVYMPPKWQKKFHVKEGSINNNLVGFEDFAPTVFELAGIKIPDFMQGRPFLGSRSTEKKAYQFCFRSNQENYHYDPCRTASDGRYKYIRNYHPYKPFALRNLYQSGMPSNIAWDEYVLSGKCTNPDWLRQFQAKEPEMLFDLQNDPDELHNLAGNAEHATKLRELRGAVAAHIRESQDLGFFYRDIRKEKPGGLYQWVRNNRFPLSEMYTAAEKASMPALRDTSYFTSLLKSNHPELRYWGAVGYVTLASKNDLKTIPEALRQAMADHSAPVAITAAEGIFRVSKDDQALAFLFNKFSENDNFAYSALENLTLLPEYKPQLLAYTHKLEKLLAGTGQNGHDRMSVHLKIRSLLVNLGVLPVRQLFPDSDIQEGKKVNAKDWKAQYPRVHYSR